MEKNDASRDWCPRPGFGHITETLRGALGVLLLTTQGCATPAQITNQIPTIYIPAVDNSSRQASAKAEPEIEEKRNRDCLPASQISFLKVRDYHEQVAAAQDETGWYFIDHNANPVHEERFDYAESFENGKAAVNKNGELYYVDHQMRRVVPPEEKRSLSLNASRLPGHFDEVSPFIDGMAEARVGRNYFFVDENYSIAFQEDPNWTYTHFSEGLMVVIGRKDKKAKHVDKNGRFIYPDIFDSAGDFNEDMAPVSKNSDFYHIRPDASPAYSQRHDYVGDFNNGMAPARDGNRWFHITPNGGPAYEGTFDGASPYSEDMSVVRKGSRWFHIGRSGNPYPDRKNCPQD